MSKCHTRGDKTDNIKVSYYKRKGNIIKFIKTLPWCYVNVIDNISTELESIDTNPKYEEGHGQRPL